MYTQQEKQISSEKQPQLTVETRVFDIAVVVFACIGIAAVLTVVEPPRLIDRFDVFATPEVLPEWYVLPAFWVIKAMPTKLIGLAAMSTVVGGLFLLPFLPDLGKRLPGGPWLARLGFLAIHAVVIWLGFLAAA